MAAAQRLVLLAAACAEGAGGRWVAPGERGALERAV
eukprot:COSAG04_NODE_1051_length_8554_cov_151.236310_1_plen_35_part_10